MSVIQTVCGNISPGQLGHCQTHEHIWCDFRLGERSSLSSTVQRDQTDTMIYDDRQSMLEELKAYRALGGSALVEVTTAGWGRDLAVLEGLSRDAGVHIIATAGFYIEPAIPRWVDTTSIADMAHDLIGELVDGEPGTGLKPGLYKSGILRGRIEGPELKALRAVARAVRETGAAMTTHTTGSRRYEVPGGTMGIQHLKIFNEEGAPAHRLIVGHVDERPDLEVLSSLADAGCFIQFDVIGKLHWLLDETRAQLIRQLKSRGHLDKVLLGTDRCRKVELHKAMGGLGYTYLFESFFDTLREHAGLSQGEIESLVTDNPARALTLTS